MPPRRPAAAMAIILHSHRLPHNMQPVKDFRGISSALRACAIPQFLDCFPVMRPLDEMLTLPVGRWTQPAERNFDSFFRIPLHYASICSMRSETVTPIQLRL